MNRSFLKNKILFSRAISAFMSLCTLNKNYPIQECDGCGITRKQRGTHTRLLSSAHQTLQVCLVRTLAGLCVAYIFLLVPWILKNKNKNTLKKTLFTFSASTLFVPDNLPLTIRHPPASRHSTMNSEHRWLKTSADLERRQLVINWCVCATENGGIWLENGEWFQIRSWMGEEACAWTAAVLQTREKNVTTPTFLFSQKISWLTSRYLCSFRQTCTKKPHYVRDKIHR